MARARGAPHDMTIRVFPVASVPGVHFSNDFGVPRPGDRAHAGIDIFAPRGTPALAVDNGTVRFEIDPIGGLSYYLRAADSTTYYGTHLSGVEGSPRSVRAGEVIGYVGNDGNAAGTPPHLHFEVHPGGRAAVNPFLELSAAPRQAARATAGTTALKALALAGGLGAAWWWYARAGGARVIARL